MKEYLLLLNEDSIPRHCKVARFSHSVVGCSRQGNLSCVATACLIRHQSTMSLFLIGLWSVLLESADKFFWCNVTNNDDGNLASITCSILCVIMLLVPLP
ncbi:hypothetical protein HS088_TW01G00318 [Tripterygium wilfordii]|uniref:Uncharacterized protein n=1 Tax=Tripterygium wilfordii TaxID=458696 RepID=A0A7J7E1J4_TRIWF|nr:hypothetical protein HS088_TW01G00318 [Tripterygium wilfordii]